MSNNYKGKEIISRNSNYQKRRPKEYKDALVLVKEKDIHWSSSSKESEWVPSPKFKGETSIVGLNQMMGGKGPIEGQYRLDIGSPKEGSERFFRTTQAWSDQTNKPHEVVDGSQSSSGNSFSHVPATLFASNGREMVAFEGNTAATKKKSTKSGSKIVNSVKRHSMITRKDRLTVSKNPTVSSQPKVISGDHKRRWNLEEEVAKGDRKRF
ncbi:hypothetical protein Q3G72_019047 [Acer saccharum]|nr:hypothetical protein Q3G72_019047 [Acer saccharum]